MDIYIFWRVWSLESSQYFISTCIFAMYPSTEKMTNPATKLVTQLMVLRGDVTM